MSELKNKVLEFIEITKQCPENLQGICFELLLKDYLVGGRQESGRLESGATKHSKKDKVDEPKEEQKKEETPGQEDIALKDIHLKVRKFLEKYKLTIDDINRLFYKEGESILPLFDDLRTTTTAEAQVRITMIQSLISAFSSGEFQAEVNNIRTECQERKCYDTNNFGTNFNNNASLFDFNKYGRGIKTIKLSEPGKAELSKLISELK